MSIKYRILAIILLIVLTAFFSGCWDYIEFNDIIQVYGVGIDYEPRTEIVTLTIQYIQTESIGKNNGQNQYSGISLGIIKSDSDINISEAFRRIQEKLDKTVFFGYAHLLMIGEEAAFYIMDDIIELMERSVVLRTTTYMAVSRGKAEDVLNTYNDLFNIPATNFISGLIQSSINTGAAYPVSIQDYEKANAMEGIEPVIPIVSVKIEERGDNSDVRDMETGQHIIEGMGVFKGGILKGCLDDIESQGYGWIMGKKQNSYKTAFEGGKEKDIDWLLFYITGVKSNIKIKTENEKISINVNISIKAALTQYYNVKGKRSFTLDDILHMEKALKNSVKSDAEAALKKARELKADIFGFGAAFYRQHYLLWNKSIKDSWDELFETIPVCFDVKVTVENTGTNIIPGF